MADKKYEDVPEFDRVMRGLVGVNPDELLMVPPYVQEKFGLAVIRFDESAGVRSAMQELSAVSPGDLPPSLRDDFEWVREQTRNAQDELSREQKKEIERRIRAIEKAIRP